MNIGLPIYVVHSVYTVLTGWARIIFAIPTIWAKLRDHKLDWYFCLIAIKGFLSETKQTISYQNLSSARTPILTMKRCCLYQHLHKVYNQISSLCH